MWRWQWQEPQTLWVFAEFQVGRTWRQQEPCSPPLPAVPWVSQLADFGPVEYNKGKSRYLRGTYRKIYLKGCVGAQPQGRGCSCTECLCGAGGSGSFPATSAASGQPPSRACTCFVQNISLDIYIYIHTSQLETVKSGKTNKNNKQTLTSSVRCSRLEATQRKAEGSKMSWGWQLRSGIIKVKLYVSFYAPKYLFLR